MVAAAFNFDSLATQAADCVAVQPGCMDTASMNYEPAANVAADGDCIYARPGCPAPSASNSRPSCNYKLITSSLRGNYEREQLQAKLVTCSL